MINNIVTVVSTLISLLAVCVSAYAVSSSRKSKLTAAYFNKMANAYEQFNACIIQFTYTPTDSTRDNLVVATHNAVLYASRPVAHGLQLCCNKAFDYSSSGCKDAKLLEAYLAELSALLHNDVAQFQNRRANRV